MQPKQPPNSIDAEQCVLGGLMNDDRAWDEISDMLCESDFYRDDHRILWRAISALSDSNQPCDIVTVPEWLRSHGLLDSVGNKYIGSLTTEIPGASNIVAYAGIVRDKSTRRAMIKTGNDMQSSAYADDGTPTEEKLEAAEQALSKITQQRDVDAVLSAGDAARRSLDRMEKRLAADSEITGIPTGFTDYDHKTTGLQPGELSIIAARPSMGKSAFAMQTAYNVARQGKQVACFSLEMPPEDLHDRQVSAVSGVPMQRLLSPKMLTNEDFANVTQATERIYQLPLSIVDDSGITLRSIKAISRRIHRKNPLGLIIVDYLQLIAGDNNRQRRDEQINSITTGLKQLARELRCPVICLSQLNRQVEQRDDKRPRMSDLRESGGIEQDADVIAFLYRDEVYQDHSPHEGVAELILSKQRNGPTGSIDLAWDPERVRFQNYSGPSKSEREPKNGVQKSRQALGAC